CVDSMSEQKSFKLETESYSAAKEIWPSAGRVILAQYNEDSVVVYQAYNKEIGGYAAANGRFDGCKAFKADRMTWIKTNFLWMMYRSGWGTKDSNQVVTLAIWLKRASFERLLGQAVHTTYKPKCELRCFAMLFSRWFAVYGSLQAYDRLVAQTKGKESGF